MLKIFIMAALLGTTYAQVHMVENYIHKMYALGNKFGLTRHTRGHRPLVHNGRLNYNTLPVPLNGNFFPGASGLNTIPAPNLNFGPALGRPSFERGPTVSFAPLPLPQVNYDETFAPAANVKYPPISTLNYSPHLNFAIPKLNFNQIPNINFASLSLPKLTFPQVPQINYNQIAPQTVNVAQAPRAGPAVVPVGGPTQISVFASPSPKTFFASPSPPPIFASPSPTPIFASPSPTPNILPTIIRSPTPIPALPTNTRKSEGSDANSVYSAVKRKNANQDPVVSDIANDRDITKTLIKRAQALKEHAKGLEKHAQAEASQQGGH